MNKVWLRLWLVSLIGSSNPHVMQKKGHLWISPQLVNVLNTFIFYCQHQSHKASSGNLIVQQASTVSDIFLYKSCLSHTFPRAVQSVTQTVCVHLSLPIYALLFSPRLRLSCNAGMVDSCLLIQCHSLFPLSVCFDVSIQRDQWVSQRASVSRPSPDIRKQTPHRSWSFSCMSDQFKLTTTFTEPSYKTACICLSPEWSKSFLSWMLK